MHSGWKSQHDEELWGQEGGVETGFVGSEGETENLKGREDGQIEVLAEEASIMRRV